MIYLKKLNRWHHGVKLFFQVMSFESWQEESFVINSLDESMNCIAICSNGSNNDWAVLILQCFRSSDTLGSSRDCFIVDPLCIIDKECDVLNSISVLREFLWEISVARVQGRDECEDDLSIRDNMGAVISVTGLKTLRMVKLFNEKLPGMQDTQTRSELCRMMQPAWRFQHETLRGRNCRRYQYQAKKY